MSDPAAQTVDEPRAAPSRLRMNVVYAAAPQATQLLIALVLSPYIIAKVGLAAFGLWSIVLGVLAFAQIADGGIPTLTSRHIAQAHALGEDAGIRAAIALSVAVLSALGAAVIVAACVVVSVVPSQAVGGFAGWREAIVAAAVAFACTSLGRGLASVSHGHQLWRNETIVVPASQLLGAAATVIFLEAGLGLAGLGYAAVVAGAVMLLGYGISAVRLVGWRLHGARPSRELWKDFRRQGVNLQIVALVTSTNSQADRFFLVAFAPLSFVGAYALGSRMAIALRGFPGAAIGPLITHISAIYGTRGLPGAREAYRRAVDVIASYGVAGLIVLYGAMYPAVLAWLGSQYTISATAAAVIGAGYAFNILTGPGTGTAVACGRAELDRNYNLLGLALNVSLTPILGVLFGAWGVIAATVLGMSISSIWLLISVDRWLGVSWLQTLHRSADALRNLAGGVLVAGATIAVTAVLAPQPRGVNLAIAAVACAVAGLIIGLPVLRRRHHAASAATTAPTAVTE